MNKEHIAIELEACKIISNSKDPKMLEQLDIEWFTFPSCKFALEIWKKDYSYLSFVNFSAYVKENNIPLSKMDIQELYEYPFEADTLDNCISVIKRKYRQRLIDKKITEVKSRIYSMSPEESEIELMTYFKENDLSDKQTNRLIIDVDEDGEESIIDLGKGRPEFEEIVPMKKTLITLMGDSGHLKSGQALDISIRFIKNNPLKKVIFFSKEMEFKEVQARIYAICLGVGYKSILKRKYPDGTKIEMERLTERMVHEHPDVVANLIVKSPQEFSRNSDIAKIITNEEPDIFVLDFLQWYAQMAAGNDANQQNKNVMETAAFLKNISQITNTLCIALSQLRKKSDSRITNFPRLDDMEWSGLTKQISHSVGCLFWPHKLKLEAEKSFYIISWQKVRNGETFNEFAHLNPETSKFTYPHPPATNAQLRTIRKNYLKM